MDKCDVCKVNKEWHERYNLACERFDSALKTAMTVTIIALCIMMICIILTAFCVAETIRFINGFEYVEETLVEQDGDGQNIAVLVDNSKKGG